MPLKQFSFQIVPSSRIKSRDNFVHQPVVDSVPIRLTPKTPTYRLGPLQQRRRACASAISSNNDGRFPT
jgi:hypothetical protein